MPVLEKEGHKQRWRGKNHMNRNGDCGEWPLVLRQSLCPVKTQRKTKGGLGSEKIRNQPSPQGLQEGPPARSKQAERHFSSGSRIQRNTQYSKTKILTKPPKRVIN